MTAAAANNPKGVTLSVRDLVYGVLTAAVAYGTAWEAAGNPSSPKALWAIGVGLVPVVFRKIFPNLGEATPATNPGAEPPASVG